MRAAAISYSVTRARVEFPGFSGHWLCEHLDVSAVVQRRVQALMIAENVNADIGRETDYLSDR